MSYVDGFVLAVPKANLEIYKQMATLAGQVWMEHGALSYVEAIADDVAQGETTSFPRAVLAKEVQSCLELPQWLVGQVILRQQRPTIAQHLVRPPGQAPQSLHKSQHAFQDAGAGVWAPFLQQAGHHVLPPAPAQLLAAHVRQQLGRQRIGHVFRGSPGCACRTIP